MFENILFKNTFINYKSLYCYFFLIILVVVNCISINENPVNFTHIHRDQIIKLVKARHIDNNRFILETINEESIILFNYHLTDWGFGNTFSMYLEALSCSMTVGAHFYSYFNSDEDINQGMYKIYPIYSFLQYFPTTILNPNRNLNTTEVQEQMQLFCKCNSNCWSYPDTSTWITNMPFLKSTFDTAILNIFENHVMNYSLSSTFFDLITPSNYDIQDFPLVADVVIHFRCTDIRQSHLKSIYGFLNFNYYLLIIPPDTKLIYILTDASLHHKVCSEMLQFLIEWIYSHFPNVTIATVMGKHIVESLVILTNAKLIICSASTFCMWPAIFSNASAIYFPSCKNIIGKEVFIHSNFHWINTPGHLQFIDNNDDIKMIKEKLTSLIILPDR